jgi:hypothetical protein
MDEMLFNPKWDAQLRAEPWRQVLLDAADYIDRVGWCQHSLHDENGRVCAAEALMSVTYPAYDLSSYAVAMSCLSDFVTSGEHSMAVLEWNDTEGRTGADVTDAMRGCARQ